MRAMAEPNKDWKETVAPDEDGQFTALAERLRELQRRTSTKLGPGRALHRKQHVGAEGTFEVLGDLPAPARQGMFAQPGRYKAYVRFSNGSGLVQADKKGDVRGLAIKLVGVPGKKVIPGLEDAPTQDFLLIGSPAIPFQTPREFVTFVVAAANPLTALPKLLFGVGPRRLFAVGGAIRRSLGVPIPSLATMPFYSALPVRWGDYAAKLRLVPKAIPGGETSRADAGYLGSELATRFSAGDLVWDFAVQLYRDPRATPIEDPTVAWSDDAAPPITVGRLVIPKHDGRSARAVAVHDLVDKLAFDPWHALVEHRPLGAMMRARNHAYRLSTGERGAAPEPDGSEALPA
jgi:hypothetical protein